MAEDDVALVREQYAKWNEGCEPAEWVRRYFAADGCWASVPNLLGRVPVEVPLFDVQELADGKNTRIAAFLDRGQALAAAGIAE